MPKSYETVIIVDSMIPDEAIDSEFDAIEQKIKNAGTLQKVDKWGKKKMAYSINGRTHGEYAVFYYQADADFPIQLEKGFRINENVLRWLTVVDSPWGVPADKEKGESALDNAKEPEVKEEV